MGRIMEEGAVEIIQDRGVPAFYSRLFLVKKASGRWRPMMDLSPLNTLSFQVRARDDGVNSGFHLERRCHFLDRSQGCPPPDSDAVRNKKLSSIHDDKRIH